jgi:hypothetical protein
METAKQIGFFFKIVYIEKAVEENVYLMLKIDVKNNDERLVVLISPTSTKKPFPHVFTINSISIAIGFQLLLNRCCLQFIRVCGAKPIIIANICITFTLSIHLSP